jgi:hypothetical protein
MKKLMIVALLATAPIGIATPAAAQNAPQNGVLTIYGNDKCPTNSSGEEIVVCNRRPEEERYRVPKELREAPANPDRESWAVRSQGALEAGATGIGSCSAVGPGGGIGCGAREITSGKREAKERKQAQDNLPLP